MELLTVPLTPDFEVSLKKEEKKLNTQNNFSYSDYYPVYFPGRLSTIIRRRTAFFNRDYINFRTDGIYKKFVLL